MGMDNIYIRIILVNILSMNNFIMFNDVGLQEKYEKHPYRDIANPLRDLAAKSFGGIPASDRIKVKFVAYFNNKNKWVPDPDNIFIKPIVDGIKKAGIVPDDNYLHIEEVCLSVRVHDGNNYIEVTIEILE